MCYPVCGIVHIKEPLLLIRKRTPVAAVGFLSRYLNGPISSKESFNPTDRIAHTTAFVTPVMICTI